MSSPTPKLDPIELTQEFVACPSVTDGSNEAVTESMRARLESIGFESQLLHYSDLNGTRKIGLEAKREPKGGNQERGIGYFCHNDVVSVDGWNCPHGGPFAAAIAEDRLWGRGSCDMKGSAASALSALSQIEPSAQTAPLYFFITGDEECGMAGADVLARESELFAEMVKSQSFGIIGEPTELSVVNAHKGACHVKVRAKGVAAHSSTAEGVNANWQLIPFLTYIRQVAERSRRDPALQNNSFVPPTLSFNLVMENHPNSSNITVGEASCVVFFRPMPQVPWEELRAEIIQTASEMDLEVDAYRPLAPLYTGEESDFLSQALQLLKQDHPEAVCYATDGCCFQAIEQLIVLGPGSIEQAHRADEWIYLDQLRRGVTVFEQLFRRFACS